MENNNKKVAAISAVISYIKTKDEALCIQPVVVNDRSDFVSRQVLLNMWGVSGRQSLMQMRNLMQMKAFHGVRRSIR
jgi:hypothetical protein